MRCRSSSEPDGRKTNSAADSLNVLLAGGAAMAQFYEVVRQFPPPDDG
jgi:hypothetical protein